MNHYYTSFAYKVRLDLNINTFMLDNYVEFKYRHTREIHVVIIHLIIFTLYICFACTCIFRIKQIITTKVKSLIYF